MSSSHESEKEALKVLFYGFLFFVIGIFCRQMSITFSFPIPFQAFSTFVGILLGYLSWLLPGLRDPMLIDRESPLIIFHLYLAILGFHASFTSDAHYIKHMFIHCLVCVIPICVCSLFGVWLLGVFVFPFRLVWKDYILLCCVIMFPSPRITQDFLRRLRAPQELRMMLHSESMFGNGITLLVFIYILQHKEEREFLLLPLLAEVFVAPLIGWLIGFIMVAWIRNIFKDHVNQTTIAVATVYCSYALCCVMSVTGIACVGVIGLYMASKKPILSTQCIKMLDQFLDIIVFIFMSIILILGGIYTSLKVFPYTTAEDIVATIIIYVLLGVIRAGIILLSAKINTPYRAEMPIYKLMCVCNIRGSLCVVMAFVLLDPGIYHSKSLEDHMLFRIIMLHTILVFAINSTATRIFAGYISRFDLKLLMVERTAKVLINSKKTTMQSLMGSLTTADADWDVVKEFVAIKDDFFKQYIFKPWRNKVNITNMESLENSKDKAVNKSTNSSTGKSNSRKNDGFLTTKSSDAEKSGRSSKSGSSNETGPKSSIQSTRSSGAMRPIIRDKSSNVLEPGMSSVDQGKGGSSKNVIFHHDVTGQPRKMMRVTAEDDCDIEKIKREAIRTASCLEKFCYKRLYEDGVLTKQSLTTLNFCNNLAMRKKMMTHPNRIIADMKRKTKLLFMIRDELSNLLDSGKPHFFKFYSILLVCVLDMLLIIASSASNLVERELLSIKFVIHLFNCLVLLFYAVLVVIPIIVRRSLKVETIWDIFHRLILVIAVGDFLLLAAPFFLLNASIKGGFDRVILHQGYDMSWLHLVQAFLVLTRLIRCGQLIRITPFLQNYGHHIVNQMLSKHFFVGCDMAMGYIQARMDIRRMANSFVDNRQVCHDLKTVSYLCKLMMSQYLGFCEMENRHVMVALKTKNVIRLTLNALESVLSEIKDTGLLSAVDHEMLLKILETRMIMARNFPCSMMPNSKLSVLENLSWVNKDSDILRTIMDKGFIFTVNADNVVVRRGEKPRGLYIILDGIIRSERYTPCNGTQGEYTRRHSSKIHYFCLDKSRRNVELHDFFSRGNVIGEYMFLTGKRSDRTYRAATQSEAM